MKILCDYHIHSQYSPEKQCKDSIESIVNKAVSEGLKSIGISDHLHARINEEAIRKSRVEFDKVKKEIKNKIDMYFGIEVSCLREWDLEENDKKGTEASVYGVQKDGPEDSPLTVYLPDAFMEELKPDYIIGGAHWVLGAPLEQRAVINSYQRQNMFLAKHPLVTIVAHPWWWMGHWQDENGNYSTLPWLDNFSIIPENMHKEFARAVIENNKIVEINVLSIFLNSCYPDTFKKAYIEYLKKLKDYGVTFSVGSDAHDVKNVGDTRKIDNVLEELELDSSQIWNP